MEFAMPDSSNRQIARPYVGYYPKIWQRAAALLHSLAQNHGFVDGNKRTALLVVAIFLERSSYVVSPLPGEDLNVASEQVVLDLVEGHVTFEELMLWFRARLFPL